MGYLDRTLRKELEHVVRRARVCADIGARQALAQLAVGETEPFATMTEVQKALRRKLRAHGRQLGDRRDERTALQATSRLASECAYEHWHRLLFARFLAENNLLIEPDSGVALSLEECRELARERCARGDESVDWLNLASGFAQRMLPAVFRADDPVLAVSLPPEVRQELELLIGGLPAAVFTANDSLGWTYQFWQSEAKEAANGRGEKIDAETLPAVTQLFTEDYMVEFLLHNTLGAWWTAKRRDEGQIQPISFLYLRLGDDGSPVAGTFPGWPHTVRELRVLDPCMGSGHFLVAALPLLTRMRALEEGLDEREACAAVLRDNLFGLELDPRCTQIATFALALAAWTHAGHQALPRLHLSCSGLAPNATLEEWVVLAGNDARRRAGMERLWHLFQQAPLLGSLIEPGGHEGDLWTAGFAELAPLLTVGGDVSDTELAVGERASALAGLSTAVSILDASYNLVITNVPYLGRRDQSEDLKEWCDRHYPNGRSDLATVFLLRARAWLDDFGTLALVTPQNWWFLRNYASLRSVILPSDSIRLVCSLGEEAWQTFGDRGPRAVLYIADISTPTSQHEFAGIDAAPFPVIAKKIEHIKSGAIVSLRQKAQYDNPDHRIIIGDEISGSLLGDYARATQGLVTGDWQRFGRCFWEMPVIAKEWDFLQTAPGQTAHFSGRELTVRWDEGSGELASFDGARVQGLECLGKTGVSVGQMRDLPVTRYDGALFDINACAIIPLDNANLPAIWSFCSSQEFFASVRQIDQAVKVTNATLVKVPFDLAHWRRIAAERYPNGLPSPHSSDPTQWLFNGHPKESENPLHVAVARLVGYRWPRQTGSSFLDCPALDPDRLEPFADADGIVCLPAIAGAPAAADRLRPLLVAAYGADWSADRLGALLLTAGHPGVTLEVWLRDSFFADHCDLFHQRPFVWQIWDGLPDGFSALVNYHQLAGPAGRAEQTLNKLSFTYLGDWIRAQREAQVNAVPGADARLAAALHLQRELERIRASEPPYDLFVRWKPLHLQPLGWDPDLDDGVRINLRPFLTAKPLRARAQKACILRETPRVSWDKNKGKEPLRPKADFPWFWSFPGEAEIPPADFVGGAAFDGNRWNDCHYSRAVKERARARTAAEKARA